MHAVICVSEISKLPLHGCRRVSAVSPTRIIVALDVLAEKLVHLALAIVRAVRTVVARDNAVFHDIPEVPHVALFIVVRACESGEADEYEEDGGEEAHGDGLTVRGSSCVGGDGKGGVRQAEARWKELFDGGGESAVVYLRHRLTSVCAWGKRCLGGWILWNARASRMSEGEWKVRLAREKEWPGGDAYLDIIERG